MHQNDAKNGWPVHNEDIDAGGGRLPAAAARAPAAAGCDEDAESGRENVDGRDLGGGGAPPPAAPPLIAERAAPGLCPGRARREPCVLLAQGVGRGWGLVLATDSVGPNHVVRDDIISWNKCKARATDAHGCAADPERFEERWLRGHHDVRRPEARRRPGPARRGARR